MKVFISYSWDNEAHKDWVLKVANKLEEYNEIDVIFDQYELSAGSDMTYFMEKGMTADKIIVILTPNYKLKANKRDGGVGFEYSMITSEMFDNQLLKKVIPIIRLGNKETCIPQYLKTKMYHDMKDDTVFSSRFFELLRIIFDKPQVEKPKKSKSIDLTKNEENDELIDIADNYNKRIALNREIENILSSDEGLNLAKNEIDKITNEVKEKVLFYAQKTKIQIRVATKYRQQIKVNTDNYTFQILWSQPYFNSLQDSSLHISFWKGFIADSNDGYVFEKPELIYQHRLIFDINLEKEVIWNATDSKLAFKTQDLIKLACDEIIRNEINEKSKNVKR